MTPDDNWTPNAVMDPWCSVEIDGGTEILFGFAAEHEATGGLSWVRSSPVVWFADDARRAQTESGRRYSLGRRITIDRLPTEEARLAFALLVAPYLDDPDLAPPVAGNLATAESWVIACKMARHLKLEAPPLSDPAAIREFMAANMERYTQLRMGRRSS
jgi:hypothetical protein